MGEAKTAPTEVAAADFIAAIESATRRAEAEALDALFTRATGERARMWGPSILGYGSYRYRYDSGREGRGPRVGFSPRKAKHSLYLHGCGGEGPSAEYDALLARLGKHSRAVACVYVNKLADIDLGVLEELVRWSWKQSFIDWPES
ncbi:DUF1801 domain-containing protein [Qipengyuania sediminis]|uniref:DUF1801 domain-containing protein n=1 Tax=Qipengyuania sediminis TaxID=1532023 RepID=UPI00105A9F19|nr:DUF1801 domain-containing protein [Qipengyuania sediminis]